MKLHLRACRFFTLALVTFFGGNLMISDAHAQAQGEWIDVHFHLVADKDDLESFDEAAQTALRMMDAENIRTIVIMSPPRPNENFDIESITAVAKKYAPRIVMFGGGGTLNPMLQACRACTAGDRRCAPSLQGDSVSDHRQRRQRLR